jgi:lysyl-tRNA synthetase class I
MVDPSTNESPNKDKIAARHSFDLTSRLDRSIFAPPLHFFLDWFSER